MTIIAPVRTGNSNKNLWFDATEFVETADGAVDKAADGTVDKAADKIVDKNSEDAQKNTTYTLKIGDKVVVETARGQEFGTVAAELFEATEKQLKNLRTELKPVKRKAKDIDIARSKEMKKRGLKILPTFKELAKKTNPQMNPIDVEVLLDGKKAVFYFSAPERQDFRDLVKKLCAELHIKVDMHQINERDKAKLVSGIGICGQELCCARVKKCPKHVSIKMAKAQGLSLNPENISGACGKLMCCLNYEYDLYEEFVKRAPKMKGKIDTPEGVAVVTDVNMPNETVQIKYGDPEKRVRVPVSAIKAVRKKGQPKDQNVRPNTIDAAEWEKALDNQGEYRAALFESVSLKGDDQLSEGKVTQLPTKRRRSTTIDDDSGDSERNGQGRKSRGRGNRSNKNGKSPQNKNRQRRKSGKKGKQNTDKNSYSSGEVHVRRRSRTISSGGATSARPGQVHSSGNQRSNHPGQPHNSANASSKRPGQPHNSANASGKRPGQKSSGLRPGQNSSGLRK